MSYITIEKNWRFQILSEKKISRKENFKKCISFEEQKVTSYIRGNIYFGIIVFSCLSSTNSCFFRSEDKRLLSEFLKKWGWFQGHNERFLKYLGSELKFQKIETRFIDIWSYLVIVCYDWKIGVFQQL